MKTESTLSRRTLVTTAAALLALAVPAIAAVPASACTLPPDLIERFVRVRVLHLKDTAQYAQWRDEVDRRFYTAAGLTYPEWDDLDCNDPRYAELAALRTKIYADVPDYVTEAEADELYAERWSVAEALMDQKPRTVTDIAWQLEAYLVADREMGEHGDPLCQPILRKLLRNIRTLGALPQPDDPLGVLSMGIGDGAVEA